jgi:ribonuclease J
MATSSGSSTTGGRSSRMRCRIHRGADEIGGSCVELEAQGKTILVDLGLPLTANAPSGDLLPPVRDLSNGGDAAPLGIVISHSHGDHIGLLGHVHYSIPVHMGHHTAKLLYAVAPFVPRTPVPLAIRPYRHRSKFSVGPFAITPYLVDHSGFDAYALLIEAEERRLLYSGDFRAHGRKSRLTEQLIRHPPHPVHALLLEGTTLSRSQGGIPPVTESKLEDQIVNNLNSAPGLVLACFSPQNIDRFVTFYRATRRAGRQFIGDAYLANIVKNLGLDSLPVPKPSDFRFFLGRRQRQKIISQGLFDLLTPMRISRIFAAEICRSPTNWVMLFRKSLIQDVESFGAVGPVTLIYSLWPGYIERSDSELADWCSQRGVTLVQRHTSGHAELGLLQRFAAAMRPEAVVPIHTAVPNVYAAHFANVKSCSNGEWFVV